MSTHNGIAPVPTEGRIGITKPLFVPPSRRRVPQRPSPASTPRPPSSQVRPTRWEARLSGDVGHTAALIPQQGRQATAAVCESAERAVVGARSSDDLSDQRIQRQSPL
jgi:hypothetical protein